MSVWFWLWLLISVTLVYFLAWNYIILLRQKKTWRAFAKDRDLEYIEQGLFSTPELTGTIGDYRVNFFASEHRRETDRRSRKLTAIEVRMKSDMPPFAFAVASGQMADIARSIAFEKEVVPNYAAWENSFVALSDDYDALKAYLTDDRLAALCALMKVRNLWVILAARNDVFLLRVDTPHALDERKKLEALLKRMIKAAEVCEISAAVLSDAKKLAADQTAPEVDQ
jgi:hypothetical protein